MKLNYKEAYDLLLVTLKTNPEHRIVQWPHYVALKALNLYP